MPAAPLADDPAGRDMVQAAARTVAAYHLGEPRSGAVLRVVYFHPSDRAPLPGYAERLDRVLTNVSDFYRDGLRRFGVENRGLPLERRDGRLVLHVVQGAHPASAYTYESGNATRAEIRAALQGTIDFEREHVLVLYGLCHQEPDGRYVFNAPYYGDGSQRGGFCHAADCELLDSGLLSVTGRQMVYTEHYYPRVEQSVAKFNSWYIGGIAHELGHGLGLNHDSGSPAENKFGTSLMGIGNLSYHQEVWAGGLPAYLSRATALQLVSHPLFTGSNRGRWEEPGEALGELTFSTGNDGLRLAGKTIGRLAAHAVSVLVWPTSRTSDHGAVSYPAVVHNGVFAVALTKLKPADYHLVVQSFHVNGSRTEPRFRLKFDSAGRPDVAALNGEWFVGRAESAVLRRDPDAARLVSDDAIGAAPTLEIQRRLRILRATLTPPSPLELAAVRANRVYLSDVAWTEAKVGWGQVARNHYWFDENIQNGVFLQLQGEVYEKGLYAHSPSRYGFALDAKWRTFEATIGLRDGAHEQGSAVFTVRGDGRVLYRSPILRPGGRERITADVASVRVLELVAEGGEGHPHNSWAIWAEPRLTR
jgi:hypothetical protein